MHCWIELNSKALLNNYRIFCELLGQERVMPVLKANAYGHGLEPMYEILKNEKIGWIGAAYLHEAERLRKLGYKGRILLVTPTWDSEFSEAAKLEVDMIVGDDDTLQKWLKSKNKPNVHIKFDTGLSRQGFMPEKAQDLIKVLKPHANKVAGVCTHFANVEDVLEHDYANLQLSRFTEIKELFKAEKMPGLFHISSSASALILPESRLDLCRIGISMYGQWPSQPTKLSYLQINSKVVDLQPVLTWKTKVSAVKLVRSGEYIGYGCTYKAMTDMKIAILPMGYYEGYMRISGSEQSYVLIGGRRCPLVGRISMNLMAVNVNHLNKVAAGDVVTLLGQDDGETLDATTVANWAKTIHYEYLSRLNPEIPRTIV